MKTNYQLELDRILSDLEETGGRPTLLLHSCCGPCSSYVLVHQDFRSLEANVTDTFAAVFLRLADEFVVDIVQETFQGEQVLEILHKYLLIKYLTW